MRTGLRRDVAKLALLLGGILNAPQFLLGMAKIQLFGVGSELGKNCFTCMYIKNDFVHNIKIPSFF